MGLKLLSIAAVLIAGCIVMILHELPKTIVFFRLEKRKNLSKQVLKCYRHIDPVGLIFCAAGYSGFSKAYMLRAKRDRDNIILGLTGYASLAVLALLSLLACKFVFAPVGTMDGGILFVFMIAQYISILSMSMLVVNLFPLMAFDMGLIIAGTSREKYFSILRNDYLIKMILILCVLLGIIRSICVNLFLFLYQL